jgi:hypothetical protein
MADPVKVKITYMDKEKEYVQVVPGVVKAGNAYLIRCNKTGNWTYANEERIAKLTAKFGSIEKAGTNYVGRAGKKLVKAETPEPTA